MTTSFLSTGKFAGQRGKFLRILFIFIFVVSMIGVQPAQPVQAEDATTFAIITDFGTLDATQATVATMVDSWGPEFIVTTGDNWQGTSMGTAGSTNSYENAVGNYYGAGGVTNSRVSRNYLNGDFYPVKGNHDYLAGTNRYEQYFNTLPFVSHSGTARYYDVQRGPVHFFMLDAGPYPGSAPDIATQQSWLQAALAASTAAWKIVMFHKPAYTGGSHGNATDMQWDFDGWGADFVIAGHVHIYERIHRDGIVYFTAGASGGDARTGTKIGEVYYSGSGATRVNATETSITFEYFPVNSSTPVDTYTQTRTAPTDPSITVSPATLAAFSSQPGVPSDVRSYTISGSNLTDSVIITPPAGFEISLSPASGFSSTPINLTPVGGVLSATTIYVRLYQPSAGAYSGNIIHSSPSATIRSVSVSGTAAEPGSGWTAYNDVAWASGQPNTNITTYTLAESGTATGLLKDYQTGAETPVTVTITDSGSPNVQTQSGYSGAESSSGTDAYNTFHGIADMAGVVGYGDSGWYVDLAFSGLSPSQTYTFATTANRNDSSYTARISRFTIAGVDAAVNASTSGVTVKSNESVAFSTGSNTANGYVARWSGINPGADGAFSVRVQADTNERRSYGPSVFMLQAEGSVVTHSLSVSDDGNGSVNLTPNGGVYSAGTTVTLSPVPDSGYAFSHWSGPDAGSVVTSGGQHSIVMNADKAITANFVVSNCSDVSLVAVADTYLRKSQETRNYGGANIVQVSPYTSSPQNMLFRWDLSSIPTGSTVSAASLTFQVTESSTYGFHLFNMRRAWVEGTSNDQTSNSSANWKTYNGSSNWGSGGAESTTADRFNTNLWNATTSTFGSTGSQTIPLNSSGVAAVQGWVGNSQANYGLTVQRDLEHTQSSGTVDYWVVASSEASNEAQRPRLNLTYCQPSIEPLIVTSVSTLPAFTGQPGTPSTVQSYTVSASNLSGPLAISAPSDFQISLSANSGFGSTININPSGGSVATTTIYVRFNRATEGSSSGVINHTSAEADSKTVAVSGTATLTPPWTAYNDVSGTSTPANTTEFSLNTTNGMLLNFDTGAQTGATVTMVVSGELYDLSGEGEMPNAGTDAYETFNGRADMTGAIMANVEDPTDFTADLVFNGLDPNKTYTFATSVNRAGGSDGDPAYTNRFTRYTIMNMASATNASTAGVGVVNEHSVYFCTGENTTNGYVARWTNIQPNAQGSFTVRAQPHDPQIPRVYAYGVFMLQEEASAAQTVTVTANSGQGKVYGENDPALTYTATPNVPLTGAPSRAAGENAGSYAINKGSLTAGAGYRIVFVSANFTISPKPITVTADAKSKVYGQNDPALTYAVTTGALVGNDTITGALTRESGENVGAYAIQKGSLTAGSNYNLTFQGANLTITTRPVTVTADNKSKVVGTSDPELTYTVNPALAFSDKFTGALEREAGEGVGTYEIQRGNLALSSNYVLTFVPGTFTITVQNITVTVNQGLGKVYGANDPTLTYTVSPNVPLTGKLDRAAGENVGSYAINKGSLSAGADYNIILVPADFTITPKPITVTADAKSKVYGANDPALTYTVPTNALVGSDKLNGALSRVAGENVGSYAIQKGSLTAGDNYTLTFQGANLTITPKPITVTADAKSKVYGYGDPALTYSVPADALVGDDALEGALTRAAGEDVGTYPIQKGSLTAGDNYNLTFQGANLTITARPVTVTADNKSKVAGSSDPALTYTVNPALAFTDKFTGALEREPGESVGTYEIQQGDLALSSNYAVTFVSGTFTIATKSITVTVAQGQNKVYGALDPVFTYTVSDSSVSMTGKLGRAGGENVGSYAITQGSLSAGSEYNIVFVPANFTITRKPITVTADAKSKIYGQNDPAMTYDITTGSLVGNDTLSGSLTRASGENVGTYAIRQGTLEASDNYTLTYQGSSLTIEPKAASVRPNAASKTVGEEDPELTGTLTGFLANDGVTAVYTRTSGETVDGSPYTISATLRPTNVLSNYDISYYTAQFTIKAAEYKIMLPLITH